MHLLQFSPVERLQPEGGAGVVVAPHVGFADVAQCDGDAGVSGLAHDPVERHPCGGSLGGEARAQAVSGVLLGWVSRAVIYLRRRDGVGAGEFRKFVNKQLVPALAGTGMLKELAHPDVPAMERKMWDTPTVAHDNPGDQRFHASVILGFADAADRDAFFTGTAAASPSHQLVPVAPAIHAYDVTAALTFVENGHVLPRCGK